MISKNGNFFDYSFTLSTIMGTPMALSKNVL